METTVSTTVDVVRGDWWQPARRALAWIAQAGNIGDLTTTFVAAAMGGQEVGLLPSWLIRHGLPLVPTVLLIKAAGASTVWGLWHAAGTSQETSRGRIAALVGALGMAAFAGLFWWVSAWNIAVILSIKW